MKLSFLNKKKNEIPKSEQAMKGGSYSFGMTVLVLAVLVVINVLVSSLPESVTNIDISSSRLYSVTSNTKAVISSLEDDITIYWVVQAGEEDSVIENLLSKYESLSGHITVVKKNPDTYPTFAEQYTDETVANNSLIVECGSMYRYIPYSDIYLTDVDYTTYSYVYSFDGEGAITSAIDYVTSEELPKMYVLEGHGEADLPDEFTEQLSKENIETESFSLLNEDSIPEDADCILIYAPASDISSDEKDILEDYLEEGGKLLVMAGPVEDGTLTELYSLLEDYGVSNAEGVVVESDRNYYAVQRPYVLMPLMQSSSITDSLIEENYYLIFPIASGMTVGSNSKGAEVTELAVTSDTAFSKIAGYSLTTYDKEDGDIDGPFALAVSVVTEEEGEMIWISSSDILNETFNAYSSGANMNFTINSIYELIGESDAMAIRTKSLGYNYLTISDTTASMLKIIMIGIIPVSFIVLGIMDILERRKHRNAEA